MSFWLLWRRRLHSPSLFYNGLDIGLVCGRMLLAAFLFIFPLKSSAAQSILVQWDFEKIWTGHKTDLSSSFVSSAVGACSLLTEQSQEWKNTVGIVKAPSDEDARIRRVKGSAPFSRSLAIGMSSTQRGVPNLDAYSLGFSISMGKGWEPSEFSSLCFDLGYDTMLSGYYAPTAQLYVSRNGSDWELLGECKTPDIGEGAHNFNDSFYIEGGLSVPLKPLGIIYPGETIYFRLAIGENGPSEMNDDQRHIILDNITLLASVPGAAPEQHFIVFAEKGKFAGWPANNGAWSWGDEFLVGFERWDYLARDDNHSIDPNGSSEIMFLRSIDGGISWNLEYHENIKLKVNADSLQEGECCDYSSPDLAIRLRDGIMWCSNNRGESWSEPMRIPGTQAFSFQARTSYIVDGKYSAWFFLTSKALNGEKPTRERSTVWRSDTGGLTFDYISMLGAADMFSQVPEEGEAYSIMPSVVRLGESHFVAAARELTRRDKWIQIYESKDGCRSWVPISKVAIGAHNPPALLRLAGSRLALIYGARETSPRGIYAILSEDAGKTWCEPIILRGDAASWDFGYPVAFLRSDGAVVMLYYYTSKEQPEQHIAATVWKPPVRSKPIIRTENQRLLYAFTDNYSLAPDGSPIANGIIEYLPLLKVPQDGELSISFSPLRKEYVYEVQQSADLQDWISVKSFPGGSSERQVIQADTLAKAGKLFLRVKVSERP